MKKFYILFPFILLGFSSFAQSGSKRNQTDEIVLLHTNDIHANIDNFARLAFVVDSIRKLHKNVYLLSAGDLFTGNPMVDMSPEKGFAVIDLMNRIGFSANALGNHEFDYGQEVLQKRIDEAKFPFLCANLINDSSKLKTILPFVRFTVDNKHKVYILSVLDNSANGLPETHPSKLKGLRFDDPVTTAKKYRKLAGKKDLFIALTHIGIENDTVLARQMPELDLIIGGHSHTLIDSMLLINNVMIVQAGSKLRNLGEIKLRMNKGKIIEKSYKLISLRGKENLNNEIKGLIEKYSQNELLKQVLSRAKVKLSGNEELGNFFTDAMRFSYNFDIVFQNSGGIRINEIPEGDITLEMIYRMDPFGNYLIGLNLTTTEIRSLISYSFRNGKIDLRVSGINYTIIRENNKLKEIILNDYNGNPIDENKTYWVGMNDYIFSTYQFKHADQGRSQGVSTTEVIIEYLKKNGEIDYSGVNRTFIKDSNVNN